MATDPTPAPAPVKTKKTPLDVLQEDVAARLAAARKRLAPLEAAERTPGTDAPNAHAAHAAAGHARNAVAALVRAEQGLGITKQALEAAEIHAARAGGSS